MRGSAVASWTIQGTISSDVAFNCDCLPGRVSEYPTRLRREAGTKTILKRVLAPHPSQLSSRTHLRKMRVNPSIIPIDEGQRLVAVRRYDVLGKIALPDGAFDRITALAARRFAVPISIISVVDEDRIWFKSHHGLDVKQIGRDPGLCASAILDDVPHTLPDASKDVRSLANPLVAGEFGLRFYAGVPLRTQDGFNLGTLCVIDRRPREIDQAQIDGLKDLASLVMDQLELRLSSNLQR